MDDVYNNLENFTEESTNAELREENKNLKSKLEEYAAALDKLQKEFDMLSSEHKKLEMNYSSLLKTARSEIERKTQTITKMNIEKDAMVLNAIQNRNTPFNRRRAPKDKPINRKEESKFGTTPTQFSNESMKPNFPSHAPSERKDIFSPSANSATSYKNIQTIVNNARNNEVNENATLKDNSERSRARISSRRKSMPVLSMDCERVSTDEEDVASAGMFKTFNTKEKSGSKYLDKFPNDRPNINNKMFSHQEYSKESRSSEELTAKEQYASKYLNKLPNDRPSIEDKMFGHQGYSKESRSSKESTAKEQFVSKYLDKFPNDRPNIDDKMLSHQEYSKESRSRYSKYDSDKYRSKDNHEPFQRHRRNISPDRRKRSPDRRKCSPDRNKRDAHDHSEEFYKRHEYERRRRLVSPPKDKYYHDYKQRNRDSQRSNDRSHPHDFEKYKSRGQDKHTMKHKILHDYEEQSSKRMRLDSNHKHEDERWRGERQVGPVPLDLDHLLNMSCQSPDQTHLEALPSHQAREIKLNASMKLDDPRLSSKKYTLKTDNGTSELSTVESANINVKVIDTSNWDMIKTMKMPDALLKKPTTTDIIRAVSLQKPMTSDKPNALRQNRLSCDLPDASFQRQWSTSMPDAFIQNTVPDDVPETLERRMITQTPNDQIINPLNQPKTDEIMPDASQKPNSTNEIMHNASTLKQKLTDDLPDASATKQKSSNETMPDASTQKLMSTDDLVKEIYMDIENPISNLSMESDALYDFEDDFHSSGDTNKNTNEITKEHVVEPLKSDNGSRKLGNYKIPKKSSDNIQNAKISKDLLSSNKYNDKQTPNEILTKTSIDNINNSNKTTDETCEVQDRKIPQQCSSNYQYELQSYITAKNIIEGDLELSDETSDNADVQIKQISVLDSKQNLNPKYVSLASNKKHESKTPGQKMVDFDETISQNVVGQNMEEKSAETTVIVTRKPRTRKKSLKLKDTKEPHDHKDTAVPMNKAVKKIEEASNETIENKNTSLSLDQLVKIKESITQELFEKQHILSKDKPIKKKENKSKVTTQNKETTSCLDKTIKKKESQLSENKNKVPSTDKPMKKKENKLKELPEKKEPLAMDKPIRKKENKKESHGHKIAIPIEKPKNMEKAKKKQTKPKESPENTECATAIHKQVKNKDNKTKETKFSELFGDSSSLVSPEDLGLVPAVVAPPENYVAIFEDAQDATDINTIRAAVASISMETSKDAICKSDTQSNFNMNVESTKAPTITVEPTYPNITEPVHIETVPAESSIIHTMYQNLQPEISSKDNIVKTVIISSGSQPQCASEAIETYTSVSNGTADADLHLMQCVKPTVLQDIALRALATSTPHKIWQQNVQAEIDAKNSRFSNESPDDRVDKSPVIANSDITTSASLTKDADEPDVTIFVKRRRKVVRKK